MGTKLGEVFVEFGIKGAEKMKDFAKDFSSLPLQIAGTVLAFGGLSLTFAGFMDDMLGMTKGLREFNAETGLGTDSLEKWEQVGRRVGLTNAQVQSSFGALVTGLTRLRTVGDESMVQWFGRMHINDFMKATPEQLLAEMRARYQGLSTPKAKQDFVSYMRNLGIDPAMALAFQSPLSDPSRMARMSPLYGKGGQDAAAEFTRLISEVSDAFRRDFLDFFKRIEPDLPIIAKGFENIAKALEWTFVKNFQGWEGILQGLKHPKQTVKDIGNLFMGNPEPNTMRSLWQPAKGVTVNQHFYGDVDKFDIDAGTLDLKNTIVHTMRLLGKGGI